MPRIARAVAVGFPHHVTQRGNYRQSVFSSVKDHLRYLEWLKEYAQEYSVNIWAYCLMKNHVHFIAVPLKEDSLSKTFKLLHMRYSRYINEKKKTNGHLWQGRFFSCVLDERHVYAALRYIENNPVRAGLVKRADDYRWSSARAHINGNFDTILSGDCPLTDGIKDWAAYLQEEENPSLVSAIRENTKTGRPCGNTEFIGRIEGILRRRLGSMKRGRPRRGGR
jgi:putative transposase